MEKPKNVKEMADFLGVGEDWVYTACAARLIPFTRLPGEGSNRKLIRFTEKNIEELFAAGEEPATDIAAPIPLPRRGAA